ncbi:membrane protein [Kitasatospora cystarginea]|uniref:Membrane protein n=1 Tax=Kitasatospora cystarginea TaxID=58350 RepID=A0ABN3DPS3_9ACTN
MTTTHRAARTGPTTAPTAAGQSTPGLRRSLQHIAVHLLTPLLMCLGMALAYQGAFHQPEPHHLKVAVVGTTPQVQVLGQTVKDRAGDGLDVTTLPDRQSAEQQLRDRELAGAFVPSPRHPELLVAKAGSDTSAIAAETVFQTVASKQGAPLAVTDVAPLAAGDPTGQGIFFLLVALSIGSYGSVAVIGAAGAAVSTWVRALVGLVTSLAVSVIGIATAGPLFHVVDHHRVAVWALGWLYSAGIVAVGTGLHTFLKRWTTLTLMVLFVMLNFTTSGGIYEPELQNGFFGALHSFWNGAGFVEGARSILYFDGGAGLGGRVLSLALWFAAGLVMLAVAGVHERRQRAASAPAARVPLERAQADELDSKVAEEEEEMAEAVGV